MKLNQLKKEIREATPNEKCDIDTLIEYGYMRKSADTNRSEIETNTILVTFEKFHAMIFNLIRANETFIGDMVNHKIITQEQLDEYFNADKNKEFKGYTNHGKRRKSYRK